MNVLENYLPEQIMIDVRRYSLVTHAVYGTKTVDGKFYVYAPEMNMVDIRLRRRRIECRLMKQMDMLRILSRLNINPPDIAIKDDVVDVEGYVKSYVENHTEIQFYYKWLKIIQERGRSEVCRLIHDRLAELGCIYCINNFSYRVYGYITQKNNFYVLDNDSKVRKLRRCDNLTYDDLLEVLWHMKAVVPVSLLQIGQYNERMSDHINGNGIRVDENWSKERLTYYYHLLVYIKDKNWTKDRLVLELRELLAAMGQIIYNNVEIK